MKKLLLFLSLCLSDTNLLAESFQEAGFAYLKTLRSEFKKAFVLNVPPVKPVYPSQAQSAEIQKLTEQIQQDAQEINCLQQYSCLLHSGEKKSLNIDQSDNLEPDFHQVFYNARAQIKNIRDIERVSADHAAQVAQLAQLEQRVSALQSLQNENQIIYVPVKNVSLFATFKSPVFPSQKKREMVRDNPSEDLESMTQTKDLLKNALGKSTKTKKALQRELTVAQNAADAATRALAEAAQMHEGVTAVNKHQTQKKQFENEIKAQVVDKVAHVSVMRAMGAGVAGAIEQIKNKEQQKLEEQRNADLLKNQIDLEKMKLHVRSLQQQNDVLIDSKFSELQKVNEDLQKVELQSRKERINAQAEIGRLEYENEELRTVQKELKERYTAKIENLNKSIPVKKETCEAETQTDWNVKLFVHESKEAQAAALERGKLLSQECQKNEKLRADLQDAQSQVVILTKQNEDLLLDISQLDESLTHQAKVSYEQQMASPKGKNETFRSGYSSHPGSPIGHSTPKNNGRSLRSD